MSGEVPDIADDLESLKHHWGPAYLISGEGGQLTADRPGTRWAAPQVAANYTVSPVPRDLP